nr:hypothetical protein [uncultured Undibacterium sp.]
MLDVLERKSLPKKFLKVAKMSFPIWAPLSLIKLLNHRRSSSFRYNYNVDDEVCRLTEEYSHALNEEKIESLRNQLRKNQFFLPYEEGDKLIEKLISNPSMKSVWEALERRQISDRYAIDIYTVCDSTILAWRHSPKKSPMERNELLLNIIRTASALRELIDQSEDHDFYNDLEAISDDKISWLLDALNSGNPYETPKEHIDYARFSIHEIVPPIRLALLNLEMKTAEFLKIEPLVRKPQSKNAEVHHFVRVLSNYFRKTYKQPLHETVATLACVALDRDDIDSDFVRKLVTEKS